MMQGEKGVGTLPFSETKKLGKCAVCPSCVPTGIESNQPEMFTSFGQKLKMMPITAKERSIAKCSSSDHAHRFQKHIHKRSVYPQISHEASSVDTRVPTFTLSSDYADRPTVYRAPVSSASRNKCRVPPFSLPHHWLSMKKSAQESTSSSVLPPPPDPSQNPDDDFLSIPSGGRFPCPSAHLHGIRALSELLIDASVVFAVPSILRDYPTALSYLTLSGASS
jgi:hypothetical protein